jgi:hypothetical protein
MEKRGRASSEISIVPSFHLSLQLVQSWLQIAFAQHGIGDRMEGFMQIQLQESAGILDFFLTILIVPLLG